METSRSDTRLVKRYVALDSTIGWESEIYDYSYSEPLLDEKIRHDRETLKTLARWEDTGIDPEVLATGHGRPMHLPATAMRAELERCVKWMRGTSLAQ